MAVIANIVEGSSLEQTNGKISKTIVYLVDGLTGSTTFDKESAALAATPAMRSAGPMGTRVVSKSAKIEAADKVRVTVRYETGAGAAQADPENPDLPIYEVGTQLHQENTPWGPPGPDGTQQKITVNYNDKEHPASITVDTSLYTLRITRVEVGINPGELAVAVVNKINSHPWQGMPRKTWKCVNIQASSTDGGLTWMVVYEFLYNPAGHQPIAVLYDPQTGQMYEDADLATQKGAKEIAYYKEFDFRTLGL